MKLLTVFIGAALMVVGLAVMAAAQTPTPASAPTSPGGKWTLTIDTPIGEQTQTFTAVLDGKKLTGHISRADGAPDNVVTGEFTDGRLTFTMTYEGGYGAKTLSFEGKMLPDGSLSGTATLEGMDTVNWWASRQKTLPSR